MQFIIGFSYSFPVITVNNKYQTLCICEVVSPQRSDFVLATNIPNSKGDILVLHRLNIEANGRNGRDNFSKFKFV